MLKHRFRNWLRWSCAFLAVLCGLIILLYFPWSTDRPLTPEEVEKNRTYYTAAYAQPAASPGAASDYEVRYEAIARAAAEDARILEKVTEFVDRFGLRRKAVLEIGSGRGYLQDLADDYTGLDISPSVRPKYHKKFVLGSATAMPLADGSFDGGWSIWVLEHVPNPEQALREIRRVMRNGAVFYMFPAWQVSELTAEGYHVRPASDFGWRGPFVKAFLPVRYSRPFHWLTRWPARTVRTAASWGGPTALHYRRLAPSFARYWEADSDAINSLDRHEMMLWFVTRGDECLNCEGRDGTPFMRMGPLIIRIKK